MNQPPVEVYQGLYELNRQLLNEELDKADKNMGAIYERFAQHDPRSGLC